MGAESRVSGLEKKLQGIPIMCMGVKCVSPFVLLQYTETEEANTIAAAEAMKNQQGAAAVLCTPG